MDNNHPIILIDEEEQVTEGLESLARKMFPNTKIYIANDGLEGWKLIEKFGRHSIIVGSKNLQGLSGVALLNKIRANKELKSAYFILACAGTTRDDHLKALKNGADDFLTKPVSVDHFISKLRSAFRISGLMAQNRENKEKIDELGAQVNEDREKILKQINIIMTQRLPESIDLMEKIREASVWVARMRDDIEKPTVQQIEEAANYCLVGKLVLDDKTKNDPVTRNGLSATPSMEQIPVLAEQLLSLVRHFEEQKKFIYHIFENFDGSGFPKKLQSNQIPIGSRIIRIVYDYYEFLANNRNDHNNANEQMYLECRRLYDYRLVTFFDQFLAYHGIGSRRRERAINSRDLEEGMVISRNIMTDTGLKLVSRETLLNVEKIEKILSINKSDPIIGDIYIYK